MSATKVVLCLLCILVITAPSVNGCIILNPSCGILSPLCTLTSGLLSLLCIGDPIITLQLTSGNYLINLDSNLVGLTVETSGTATATIKLGKTNGIPITISNNLLLVGSSLVSVVSGAVVNVAGNLEVAANSLLQIAGSLNVMGNSIIHGQLKLIGPPVYSQLPVAWLYSPNTVNIVGEAGQSAGLLGNGGVNAPVTFDGETSTGEPNTQSTLYFSKNFTVKTNGTVTVNGNITVDGTTSVLGRMHLGGENVRNKAQQVWVNTASTPITFTGTPDKKAVLTGNGGIVGNVTLGEDSGIAAGNSPGSIYVYGSLMMAQSSFMEIEVENSSLFDLYLIDNVFYRNGILYVNFLNGYLPPLNSRFNFISHYNSTGGFNTVFASSGDYSITGAYSMKGSSFIYEDPASPSYCTCVSVTAPIIHG